MWFWLLVLVLTKSLSLWISKNVWLGWKQFHHPDESIFPEMCSHFFPMHRIVVFSPLWAVLFMQGLSLLGAPRVSWFKKEENQCSRLHNFFSPQLLKRDKSGSHKALKVLPWYVLFYKVTFSNAISQQRRRNMSSWPPWLQHRQKVLITDPNVSTGPLCVLATASPQWTPLDIIVTDILDLDGLCQSQEMSVKKPCLV